MAQYSFGSGMLWTTPQTDALGNPIANPTPIMIGVMQEGSIDISFESKTLHGQLQFPVAVGRGKGKITGKCKFAQLFGAMFNSVMFGQVLQDGQHCISYDTSGAVLPNFNPPELNATLPYMGASFSRDMGVINAQGLPMQRVAVNPANGQYTVTTDGHYVFANGDAGKRVFLNFEYDTGNQGVSPGKRSTVMNLPMGAAPTFTADLFLPYQGKNMKITLHSCIASKLALATKQDDFLVPDFDFEAFADPIGNVLSYSLSE